MINVSNIVINLSADTYERVRSVLCVRTRSPTLIAVQILTDW